LALGTSAENTTGIPEITNLVVSFESNEYSSYLLSIDVLMSMSSPDLMLYFASLLFVVRPKGSIVISAMSPILISDGSTLHPAPMADMTLIFFSVSCLIVVNELLVGIRYPSHS